MHYKSLNFKWLLFSLGIVSTNAFAAANYMTVEIVNQSGQADANIYITAKASVLNGPDTGKDCFLSFNSSGQGSCTPVTTSTVPSQFNYPLSSLYKNTSTGKITLQIPKVASGRLYVAVKYPMDFFIDSHSMKIVDPDGFKPRDSNYYTLYDKIEYSFTDAGSWVNPTAVDFFGLPIVIAQPLATSHVKIAGLSGGHEQIIKQLKSTLSTNDKTSNKIWNKLFLNFKNDNDVTTVLRFVAPGKAMSNPPGSDPFDINYLTATDTTKFNYTNSLWNYYKTHSVTVDCSELSGILPGLGNYLFTGQVNASGDFIFSNGNAANNVVLGKPTNSIPFFAGAEEPFNAPNNTPKAIIVREFTSAFEVGLLPAPDKALLNKKYFEDHKSMFYTINPALDPTALTSGPWYDLYAKALHSFGDTQPIYAFAYDDALGQDGTLHDPNASKVTMTIGSLTNTRIPDPYTDTASYTVMPIIPEKTTVLYNGAVLKTNQSISGVPGHFVVTMNGHQANIYLKHNIVRPYFDGADGIVINHSATNPTSVEVIFPAPPAQ
jgi:hypothetical protein